MAPSLPRIEKWHIVNINCYKQLDADVLNERNKNVVNNDNWVLTHLIVMIMEWPKASLCQQKLGVLGSDPFLEIVHETGTLTAVKNLPQMAFHCSAANAFHQTLPVLMLLCSASNKNQTWFSTFDAAEGWKSQMSGKSSCVKPSRQNVLAVTTALWLRWRDITAAAATSSTSPNIHPTPIY